MRQPAPGVLLIPVAAALAISVPLFTMLPRSASNSGIPISVAASGAPHTPAPPHPASSAQKKAASGPQVASRLLCQFFLDTNSSCEEPDDKEWVSQVKTGSSLEFLT